MILLDTVRLKRLRAEMVPVLEALSIYETDNHEVTITGWQDETYTPGRAHADGRAIDLRTYDQPDPGMMAQFLKDALYPLSPHYIVLWGDDEHHDHLHVGFHKEMRT